MDWEMCVCHNSKVECPSLALGEFNIVERLRVPDRWDNQEAQSVFNGLQSAIASGVLRLDGSEPNLAPYVCIIIVLDWDTVCQFRGSQKRGSLDEA